MAGHRVAVCGGWRKVQRLGSDERIIPPGAHHVPCGIGYEIVHARQAAGVRVTEWSLVRVRPGSCGPPGGSAPDPAGDPRDGGPRDATARIPNITGSRQPITKAEWDADQGAAVEGAGRRRRRAPPGGCDARPAEDREREAVAQPTGCRRRRRRTRCAPSPAGNPASTRAPKARLGQLRSGSQPSANAAGRRRSSSAEEEPDRSQARAHDERLQEREHRTVPQDGPMTRAAGRRYSSQIAARRQVIGSAAAPSGSASTSAAANAVEVSKSCA